jgi:hypothetical protein
MHFAIRRLIPAAAALAAGWLAVPAAAAPIFDSATVSPDAISPNGDDLQDVAIITYRVIPDSANVRILLAVPGGPVVDTLQVFTRQGAGIHSLPFDGSTRTGPVADGDYEIRIFGVDSQSPDTESRVLPLLVDRVAPAISEWSCPPAIRHRAERDVLTLQACVGADAETVLVDLSALDSNFDPALVNETPLPPICRRYTYTISPGNTRADDDGIPARVEARDRAANRATASLFLCLSNHPPQVTSPGVRQNESPDLRNGDEIQVEVGFGSVYPLFVTADLSNLDSRFDPDSVRVTPVGGGLYDVRYRIQPGNTRPDATYSVRLEAYDPGCGVAFDTTATVTLDNAGFNSSLVDSFRVVPAAFSPAGNGYKQVRVRFNATVDRDREYLHSAVLTALRKPCSCRPTIPPFSRPHTVAWTEYRPADPTAASAGLLDLQTSVARPQLTVLQFWRDNEAPPGGFSPVRFLRNGGRTALRSTAYGSSGLSADLNFNRRAHWSRFSGKYDLYSSAPIYPPGRPPVPRPGDRRRCAATWILSATDHGADNLPPLRVVLMENPALPNKTHSHRDPLGHRTHQKNLVLTANFSCRRRPLNATTRRPR